MIDKGWCTIERRYGDDGWMYSPGYGFLPGGSGVSSLLTGLVAWWNLDEASGNRLDASGNGKTLTEVGSVGSAAGKIGNAAGPFPTVDDYLTATGSVSSPFSCSLWWKANVIEVRAPLIKCEPDSAGATLMALGSSSTQMRFAVGGSAFEDTIPLTKVADTWYHTALVYDGTNAIRYFNGAVIADSAKTGAFGLPGTTTLGLGASDGRHFDGLIDLCGVWSRALTGGEVATLYNAGAGKAYPWS